MGSQLVGRGRELAVLTRAVHAAEGGQGGVVLLSGQAGIGKSRLGTEAVAIARAHGFTILSGQADPLQTGLAYAPVVAALRRHLASLTEFESGALLAGLPDLGRLIADPRLPPPVASGDPELDRTRMFEAVLRLVARVAARAPTLVFVDDLHWADRGTVELVHYLGHGSGGHRLLVLCGYRTAEPGGTLASLAATVRRRGSGGDLALAPLTDAEVAEMVRDLLGADPTPRLLHNITARTMGVPLFVTALVPRGDTTEPEQGFFPAIVRDVVLGKLTGLDEPQRALLELIAIAGEAGSTGVLANAWRHRSPDVRPRPETGPRSGFDETLRQLLRTDLIREQLVDETVTFRVAHPLYAEVAYAELTANERAKLHATVATAIEETEGDSVLVLAPHYLAAGDRLRAERAIEVLAAAGRRALDVFAAQEATAYLAAALGRARVSRPDVVADLLDSVGVAYQGAGRLDEAAAAWSQRLALAEEHGDRVSTAALRIRLAILESERGNHSLADAHAEARLALTGPSDPHSAMLRWVMAIRHWDVPRLRALSEQMRHNQDSQDPAVRSLTLESQGYIAILDGDFAAAHDLLCSALRDAELCEAFVPGIANSARRLLAGVRVLLGDIPAALDCVEDLSLTRAGFHLPSALCGTKLVLAAATYFAGRPLHALSEIEGGIAVGRRMGLHRLTARMLVLRAFLLAELGRTGEAERCLDSARDAPSVPGYGFQEGWDAAESAIALHTGRPERAAVLTDPLPFRDALTSCLRVVAAGDAAASAGDHVMARRVADVLRTAGRTAPLLDALADRQEGLLAATRGDRPHARDLLDTAAERLDTMGARLLSVYARLESLEQQSQLDSEALAGCLAVFEKAGVTPWRDRARRLARTAGIRIAAQRAAQKPGGKTLSRRETEVVDLVAQGLSNAEIASRLFLSERT
ncbi:MAG: AAA family ATPase, partial [Kutzneria sp.]|nr:AAA family ATPase [Kutzneria sp.]